MEAYIPPGQPPLGLLGEVWAQNVPRPDREEQRREHAYMTKCRRELCVAVPKYRGPMFDNWPAYKRKVIMDITNTLPLTEVANSGYFVRIDRRS